MWARVVVPLLALAAALTLGSAPPAEATVYPSGCHHVYHAISVATVSTTVAWVHTETRVCQGTAGHLTQSSGFSVSVEITGSGDMLGLGNSSGIDTVFVSHIGRDYQTYGATGHLRACFAGTTLICYPSQTFSIGVRMFSGSIDGNTTPNPEVIVTAACTNWWCDNTGWYLGISVPTLYFTPPAWSSGRVAI
jgi:hypothetical protein